MWTLPMLRTGTPVLLALLATACVLPSPGPPPPRVDVLAPDPRFGVVGADVLNHPDLAPKIRGLFGADWTAAATARGGTAVPASDFFGRAEPPRRLGLDGTEYVAVTGCAAVACRTHRGLLLVRADGERFRARLDEAGYTHYYVFGVGAVVDQPIRAQLDAAWAALERQR